MPDLPSAHALATPTEQALATIRDHLRNLRFGSIALTVHEGKIVQLEITEKHRLTG
jgi:hypothetical protein